MKILRSNLLTGLNIASRVTPKATSFPILNNVYLKAENDSLQMVSSNLESVVVLQIVADVSKSFITTLPTRELVNVVSTRPEDSVEFVYKEEDHSVRLKFGKSQATLKGMDAVDYIKIYGRDELVKKAKAKFTVETSTFLHILNRAMVAAWKDNKKETVHGVNFTIDKDLLTLMATDGLLLANMNCKIESKDNGVFFVGYPALLEIANILRMMKEPTATFVFTANNQIALLGESFYTYHGLPNAKFPDIGQYLKHDHLVNSVQIDLEPLRVALRTASIYAVDQKLKLHAAENVLTMSAYASEIGDCTETLECQTDGELTIALNSGHLNEVLRACNGKLTLYGGRPSDLAMIFENGDDTNYWMLVPFVVS